MNLPPCKQFAETVLKNGGTKHVEIEFRLGRKNREMFDPNVGEDTFRRVQQRLQKYTGWEKVQAIQDEVYYWPNNTRCVYNDRTGTSVCIRKEKMIVTDMTSVPLDVRMAVSKEIPVPQPHDEAIRNVTRKRTSYIRKNVSIDLTEVQGSTGDIDDERKTVYQIEIEILNPTSLTSIFDVYTILWKISDVLKICE
jgi:hypothetical protein